MNAYRNFIVILVAFGVTNTSLAFRTLFDLGSYEAKENLKTNAGIEYEKRVQAHIEDVHAKSMKKCFEEIKNPELKDFSIALEVSKKGVVQNIDYRPHTKIALCFGEELKKDALPEPPTDLYWIRIDMQIAE